jgi:Fur family transcriptional regulator, ferric uptake regulator
MNNKAERAGIKKQWINVIKKNQYKLTTQRKNIITFLAKEKYPRSADDIYIELKSEYPEIGIATLYRTLDLLLNLKLIQKVNIASNKSFYLFPDNSRNNSAVYLVCDKCGKLVSHNKCLNNSVKVRLIDNAAKNIFDNCRLQVNSFKIFFSGLCEECSKEMGPPR